MRAAGRLPRTNRPWHRCSTWPLAVRGYIVGCHQNPFEVAKQIDVHNKAVVLPRSDLKASKLRYGPRTTRTRSPSANLSSTHTLWPTAQAA